MTAPAAASAQPASAAPAARVPASFQPAAESFINPSWGVVLGGVGCQPGHTCRARLVVTADGGAHWRFLAAPEVSLGLQGQVDAVMFASRRDGWLYGNGPDLYATHDGGAHWRAIFLGGPIRSMATGAGTTYAMVHRSSGNQLWRSPAATNAWTRAGTMTGSALGAYGKAAWFGSSTQLWATTNGVRWHRYPFACPAGTGLEAIAAASRSHVAFLCAFAAGTYHTVKDVLVSVNGGRTEQLTGHAPLAGDLYGPSFAVPPGRASVITIAAVTPGPDYLYRSANAGKTWVSITVPRTAGGMTLTSLAYVSRSAGAVVVVLSQLLRTTDAGLSWHAVTF